MVCTLCVGAGWLAALRVGLAVGYFVAVVFSLSRRELGAAAVLSCGAAAVLHILVFLPRGIMPRQLPVAGKYVTECVGLLLFGIWLVAGVLAIWWRGAGGRRVAWVPLAAVISPGILNYLDHAQFLACSLCQIEWWHIRPFAAIARVLWGPL